MFHRHCNVFGTVVCLDGGRWVTPALFRRWAAPPDEQGRQPCKGCAPGAPVGMSYSGFGACRCGSARLTPSAARCEGSQLLCVLTTGKYGLFEGFRLLKQLTPKATQDTRWQHINIVIVPPPVSDHAKDNDGVVSSKFPAQSHDVSCVFLCAHCTRRCVTHG